MTVRKDDAGTQVAANKPHYAPVCNPSGQPLHQQSVVHRVEEAFQVAVYGKAQPIAMGLFHLIDCHFRTTPRTESEAVHAEVGFEEWTYDLCDCLLNDAIQHGRDAQRSLTSGGFGDHHPQHGCRMIGTLFKR